MILPRLLVLLALLLGPTTAPGHALDAPGPGAVTGRVVDADGRPVGGVVVQLLDLERTSGSPRATTSEDGRFAFPGGTRPASFLVAVCEAGGRPCRQADDADLVVRRFFGPQGRSFSPLALGASYTTTGDSGALSLGALPVVAPGVLAVHLRNGAVLGETTGQQWLEVSGTRTELTGHDLVVRGLAPGVHRVRVLGQERVVRVRSGLRTDVTFDEALPAATGRVVRLGRPVADVWVQVSDGQVARVTRTDRAGRWSVRGLTAGTHWTVRVGMEENEYLSPHERTAPARRGKPVRPPTFAVGVPHAYRRVLLETGDTVRVDAVSVRDRVGELRVRAPEGTLREVALLDRAGRWVAALPFARDPQGIRYLVDQLPAGRYTAIGSWRDGLWRSASTPAPVSGGRTTVVTLASRAGTGSLTVRALPGQVVQISADSPERGGRSFHEWGSWGEQGVGRTGAVDFRSREPGDYRIVVSRGTSTAQGPLPEPQVVRVAQEPVDLDTRTAPRRGSVEVHLVDGVGGDRLPWTRTLARQLKCGNDDVTDAAGPARGAGPVSFVLRTLPAGTYECRVEVFAAPGAPYNARAEWRRASLATDVPLEVVTGQDVVVELPVTYRRSRS